MCDNERECEFAKRHGFVDDAGEGRGPWMPQPESPGDATGRGHDRGIGHAGHEHRHEAGPARHGGHHGGCGSTPWHGEWRGREIVDMLLSAFDVEVTVLDAEDRIVGFSGGERIFARSDELLGKSVFACHPLLVRDGLQEVLDALRAGEPERRREVRLPDGSVALVRYVARRSPEGAYLGTLQLAARPEPARRRAAPPRAS